MDEITAAEFAAAYAAGAAHVVDVREPWEYLDGHVPGAVLLPLGRVAAAADGLPRTGPVYVVCATGNRSKAAAAFMRRAGVDAWSVMGGTAAWIRSGHPVVTGPEPGADPATAR